jgi:hypothetical protein
MRRAAVALTCRGREKYIAVCTDGSSLGDSLVVSCFCGEGLGDRAGKAYGLPVGTEGKDDGFFSLSRFLLAISTFLIRSIRCW